MSGGGQRDECGRSYSSSKNRDLQKSGREGLPVRQKPPNSLTGNNSKLCFLLCVTALTSAV